jgi:hypothetical protein
MSGPIIWYFEPSAIGFLRQKYSASDARATRDLQREKGRWLAMSPITLIEILSTPAKNEREALLFFAQNFFERDILVSPEEAIARFIEAGCPSNERSADLRSLSHRKMWREAVDDPQRTLQLDDISQSGIQSLRVQAKLLYRAVRQQKIDASDELVLDYQITAEFLVQRIKHPRIALCTDRKQRNTFKTVALLVMLMVCAEITPGCGPYRSFWRKLNCTDVMDRFDYLAVKVPELFFRGPFLLMAVMAELQAKHPFSRGMIFDCLHTTYLAYCNVFFTDDTHFSDFRTLEQHPAFQKIRRISELRLSHTLRPIEMPEAYAVIKSNQS